MHFSRVAAIVLRVFYLLRGSPARILPLFVWVAVDIVCWGFITKYLNSVAASGFNFVPALLGEVLLWDFFSRVILGVTTVFFEDVWSRNFLNVFATPLSIREYIAGLVLSSTVTSAVGLIVMVLLAIGIFGLPFFTYGFLLIPFLLVLFLFGIAVGIFGVAVVLRLGPAAEWLVWPIPVLLSPFVGVYYPLAILPRWMQTCAHFLPPSYVFEGMRTIVRGGTASTLNLFLGTLLAVVDVLLASWFFTRVYRYAVRTGLIARYSAESVG